MEYDPLILRDQLIQIRGDALEDPRPHIALLVLTDELQSIIDDIDNWDQANA